jgi:hypothetical protein
VPEHVVDPPRLRITRDEVAVHGDGIAAGAEAAPERAEPPGAQKLNPAST